MEQEKLNSYSVRITQANRTQLVIITYEIIEDSVMSAKMAYHDDNLIEFQKEIRRIQKLLNELMGALDFRYELSRELLELYRFCGKCIMEAMYQKDIEKLDAVLRVIAPLKDGFLEVAKGDHSESVMKNTQTLYAGLTYGKHSLNEVYVSQNEASRGFRA